MSERRAPSYTTRKGRRGRHKAANSPETLKAEALLGLPPVVPPAKPKLTYAPPCPAYMSGRQYAALVELRYTLGGDS